VDRATYPCLWGVLKQHALQRAGKKSPTLLAMTYENAALTDQPDRGHDQLSDARRLLAMLPGWVLAGLAHDMGINEPAV
jgi:hypothetical protein